MSKTISSLLLLLAAMVCAHAADSSLNPNAPSFVMELTDGSRVIGTPVITNLQMRTSFGRVDIALALVQSIDFKSDKETVTLALRNGDKVQGALSLEAVELQTVMGRVKIPFNLAQKILVRLPFKAKEGLVLHFSFEGATGDVVKDQSGQENHGKVHGAKPTATGKVGGGMSFDGQSFIQVPHSDSLVSMQKTREFSCALWIKPQAILGGFPVIIGKGGNFQPKTFGGYELTLNAAGGNDLVFFSGDYHYTTVNNTGRWINQHLQEWIHVVSVISPEKDLAKFYVNGESTGDETGYGSLKNINFDLPNDLYIGARDPGHHPNRTGFDGVMDELMIFNRALPAEEIRQLYQSQK